MGEPQTGERKIGILKIFGKILDFFWKLFLAVFGPFSASPGAGAKPGRSHGSWLRPGFALAPEEDEKHRTRLKIGFQEPNKRTSFLAMFGPFSAMFGPPTPSREAWLRLGGAPAPGEAEKGPNTAKNDFQNKMEFPEFPEN